MQDKKQKQKKLRTVTDYIWHQHLTSNLDLFVYTANKTFLCVKSANTKHGILVILLVSNKNKPRVLV